MNKVAVVILADLNENHTEMARVTNALQIAQEFIEAEGDEALIVFDGGGVASLAAMLDPDHDFHGVYNKLKPYIQGACLYCAKAFDVYDTLNEADVPMLDDYKQHPSIRGLVETGYQVMTF
jgi:hypothetical protein